MWVHVQLFFFFKQKTAYEMLRSLVGSEMCIRDRLRTVSGAEARPIRGVAGAPLLALPPDSVVTGERLSLIHI